MSWWNPHVSRGRTQSSLLVASARTVQFEQPQKLWWLTFPSFKKQAHLPQLSSKNTSWQVGRCVGPALNPRHDGAQSKSCLSPMQIDRNRAFNMLLGLLKHCKHINCKMMYNLAVGFRCIAQHSAADTDNTRSYSVHSLIACASLIACVILWRQPQQPPN